jgi:protein-tyrosine phosphatase
MCESDYNWILNDVAVGNIRAAKNLTELKANGISAVICAIPNLPYSTETYKKHGFSVFHIPIDDSPDVDIERWFDDASDYIMANRLLKKKILVHCHAGMSRSVSLTCAFLMNLFRCNDVKAMYWIRDKRPCVAVNPGFLRQLASYSRRLGY